MYLVAKLVKAFHVAENESQQRKDLPQADFFVMYLKDLFSQ